MTLQTRPVSAQNGREHTTVRLSAALSPGPHLQTLQGLAGQAASEVTGGGGAVSQPVTQAYLTTGVRCPWTETPESPKSGYVSLEGGHSLIGRPFPWWHKRGGGAGADPHVSPVQVFEARAGPGCSVSPGEDPGGCWKQRIRIGHGWDATES